MAVERDAQHSFVGCVQVDLDPDDGEHLGEHPHEACDVEVLAGQEEDPALEFCEPLEHLVREGLGDDAPVLRRDEPDRGEPATERREAGPKMSALGV